jgi:glycosyltransferase involved in cell wall biosynthesis
MAGGERLRILQVIPYFTPNMGGDVNFCYNISKGLAERNDVTILTTDYEIDREYSRSLNNNGVRVIPLHCTANIGFYLVSPSAGTWIRDNISNFDVVHMHTFRSYQNPLVHRYSIEQGVPYVIQAHGSVLRRCGKTILKWGFDSVYGHRLLRDADAYIAITEKESEQYAAMGASRERIRIVTSGIEDLEPQCAALAGSFRRKYGIRDNDRLILYVGRLHKSKGVDMLFDAFCEVTRGLKNSKLAFVGPDYGQRSKLEKMIRSCRLNENVVFTGFVSRDEKIAAYADADVFVTPSYYGFPQTFLEACACGTPIITTKEGDGLDWIDDGVGCVVDYDSHKLAEAIIGLLEDSATSDRYSVEGRRLAREEFNWNRVVDKIEEVYMGVIRRRKTEQPDGIAQADPLASGG